MKHMRICSAHFVAHTYQKISPLHGPADIPHKRSASQVRKPVLLTLFQVIIIHTGNNQRTVREICRITGNLIHKSIVSGCEKHNIRPEVRDPFLILLCLPERRFPDQIPKEINHRCSPSSSLIQPGLEAGIRPRKATSILYVSPVKHRPVFLPRQSGFQCIRICKPEITHADIISDRHFRMDVKLGDRIRRKSFKIRR